MAVGEAITNLLAAPIALDRVKLSCNWMAACSDDPRAATAPRPPGDDAALYDTVRAVGMELCPALGIGVPVGKDSLSMRTRWQGEGGEAKQVTAPVSLVVTAFATIDDVRSHSTPQLMPGDTTLILVDLGRGRMRMGGSMLAQVTGQLGAEVPDLDDPRCSSRWSTRSRRCVTPASFSRTTTAATAACGRQRARWRSPATSA